MTAARTTQAADEAWRLSLALFAHRISGCSWKPYRHLRWIARQVQDAVVQGGARIILNMPPRHGKSELLSRRLPLWFLHWYPDRKVILASYIKDLAEGWSVEIKRDLDEHADELGIRLRVGRHDRDRMDQWTVTPGGGSLVATGVGGAVTGKGASLVIVDDPIKNDQDARSDTKVRELRRWWNRVIMTRLERGASIILVQTRWNEYDLTGWLRDHDQDGKWRHIVLPAIAHEGDPLGRSEGEPLCPQLKPLAELEALRDGEDGVGSAAFETMYQQDPTPSGASVFQAAWFQTFDRWPDPSSFDTVIQSWDLTFGGESEASSFAVGQVWGVRGKSAWLLAEWRKRAKLPEVVSAMVEMIERFPQTESVLCEDKALGPAVQQSHADEIPGLIMVSPGGRSKLQRASSVSPMVEAGNVHIPSASLAPWIGSWKMEVSRFPHAKKDDRVDCLSYALARVREGAARVIRISRWSDRPGA